MGRLNSAAWFCSSTRAKLFATGRDAIIRQVASVAKGRISGAALTSTYATTTPDPPGTTSGRLALLAGSLPVGTAVYDVPVTGTVVYVAKNGSDTTGAGSLGAPYATLGKAAGVAPDGSTIVMREGLYHEGGSYVPGNGGALAGIRFANNNVTVQNYPGDEVWLDGSEAVSGWTFDGTNWRLPFVTRLDRSATNSRGKNSAADVAGAGGYTWVNPAFPTAAWSEQLYLGGKRLRTAASLSDLGPGKFFVEGSMPSDGTTDQYRFTSTAYVIRDNPTGKETRIGTIARAMTLQKSGLKFRGIGFRRYVSALCEFGMVYSDGGDKTRYLSYEHCVFEDAQNEGIHALGNDAYVGHCTFRRCGDIGLGASGDRTVGEFILFEENVWNRYNYGPASGAVKTERCWDQVWRHNMFRKTYGHGLWFDQCAYRARVYGNEFWDGYGYGVAYEISARGYISDNLFVRQGVASDIYLKPTTCAAIWLSGSNNTEVWNNTMVDCAKPMHVGQDSRRPLQAGNNGGKDPTRPDSFFQTEMTWIITRFVFKNNFVYGVPALDAIQSAFWSEYGNTSGYGVAQSGVETGGNLYNRKAANTPARFCNQSASTSMAWFNLTGASSTGAASWKATTGETGSVLAESRDAGLGAYPYEPKPAEVSAVSPVPLDTTVASMVGRPAGATHVGLWATPA